MQTIFEIGDMLNELTLFSLSKRTIDCEDVDTYGDDLLLGGLAIQVIHTKGILLIFETIFNRKFETIKL
jgi:hypothetical protein